MSWATKRKFIYSSIVILILLSISAVSYFKYFHKSATCGDGIKNGDETGIDCGGSCKNICTSDSLSPVVYWSKVFNVSGEVYNLAAYIENPNTDSKNIKATYEFKIYDDKNILLGVRAGETFIPKNKKFVIFEPGFEIKNRKPKYVEFKFTSFGVWQKDVLKDPDINISYSPLTSTSTTPRISGTISNKSLQGIAGLELVALVLDNNENTVAVSRTFVDNLTKNSSQDFVFTWPKPFNLGTEACVNPVDVALVLDRSGSMQSESQNPPEPFNTVKNTAKDFVKSLSMPDRISLVSFGTDAILNSESSDNKQKILDSIDSLFLSTSSAQTNIGDGLASAFKEITSNPNGSKQVIILLTDGQPTEPIKKTEPDYPKTYAQSIAKDILSANVDIYTIGLGKDISDDFLNSLVSDSSHYFRAPTKENLSSIYSKINSAICVKKPSVVTIMYRILP